MVGVIVAAVMLLACTVFGLVRRRRDGVLRPVAVPSVPVEPAEPAEPAGAGSAASVDVHPPTGGGMASAGRDGATLRSAEIGAELGARATLVQFSSAFCAPCRATRRILGEVAEQVDGVAHVEIDAEARLDLVRRLNILRTPTVLILDATGAVVRRAVGQPRKADVIAALGEAIA